MHDPIELSEITLRRLRLKLRLPFTTSFDTAYERDTVLVILTSNDNLIGVGEAPTHNAPVYDHQYTDATFDVLHRFLIPSIKHPITSAEQLQHSMARFKGQTVGTCGIEAAYWHLVTQVTGQSLKALWGGQANAVVAGFSIGGTSVDDVLARAHTAVEAGFKRLKIKIWPGFEGSVMTALRRDFPDIMLQVDANCAYDPFDPKHQRALKALDYFDLLLIEQPFGGDDMLDHVRFQADHQMQTPIALDESIRSLNDARRAYKLWQMFDIGNKLVINVKPPRVGGYREARRIANYVEENSIPCWMGGMLETCVGKWMNIILSSHPGFTLPGDHLQPQPYYERDIALPLPTVQPDGFIAVPATGTGFEIDWEAIEKLTIERKTISF